jgi:hypothetical protein
MSEAVLYCRAVESGHLSHRTALFKALRLAGPLVEDCLALLGFLGPCPLLAKLMAPHCKPSAPTCPLLSLQVAPDVRCQKNRDAFYELDVRHTLLEEGIEMGPILKLIRGAPYVLVAVRACNDPSHDETQPGALAFALPRLRFT